MNIAAKKVISMQTMQVTNKRFLALLTCLVSAWALVYFDALLGMEAIWSTSDTFAHGYFILPISLWLVWRDKDYLLQSRVRPTWLALPFLMGSLFFWLFAYAADINVLGQLSAVSSLICLLWLMIGNKLAWRYKFPLAYLLFAVPMGENLIPWLQDVTAWFTVFFLKLNGIPVYVDGLYIQIPTGMFEVAVACSGIRYLIASLAVGTLFGYLTYNKLYKQVLFFCFAMFLPILANGIRAYGIVAIAYYSDMEYATGADHLIYGWLFFGLVIMLMFWIGGLFADKILVDEELTDKATLNELANNEAKNTVIKANKMLLLPLLTFPLLFFTLLILKAIPVLQLSEPVNATTQIKKSSWGIHFEHAFDSRLTMDNSGIEKFSAVYGNKQNKGELISWANVTHDHDRWTEVASKTLMLAGKPAMLVHMRDINGRPRSYLYQYKIGDFYTVSNNKAKLMQAWNSLSRQSDYSEIRAVSLAGISDLTHVEKVLSKAFLTQLFNGSNLEQ
ncbi:exosortase A [Colwellia sp. TT2012]|uniref:exosortase A n=1 Tax=Colwellia sp. TT2012 TaxID=1720342 RepID=UPI00070E3E26|nr:exosortase A [Colwellia sp. TT2012]